jgi:hypothetical protein
MQKVEGSSPFSRSSKAPQMAWFFDALAPGSCGLMPDLGPSR